MDPRPDDRHPGRAAAGETTLYLGEAVAGRRVPDVSPDACRIDIEFVGDGSAAEVLDRGDGSRVYRVGGEWRRLSARFAPFPLVQDFVARLLAERPARVVVDPASGVAVELARLADALGLPVTLRPPARARVDGDDAVALRWLRGLLAQVDERLPPHDPSDAQWLDELLSDPPVATDVTDGGHAAAGTGYEAYALGRRDHALLQQMQRGFAGHFNACSRVLDLGCGTGVFLDLLARRGIAATGVERNAVSARYARGLGLDVVDDDALAFVETAGDRFDGVYCSHFIEHLPVDAAERLLHGVARVLAPGGLAVFVFPDPESIRSQLLGFWRDPEHVRFYHPELVELLAAAAGLDLVRSSLDLPGRRVVPFALEPPLPAHPVDCPGPWQRMLHRLGIAPASELRAERARGDALERALRRLWDVNQTWAWDDNAVLCFRRRDAGPGRAGA